LAASSDSSCDLFAASPAKDRALSQRSIALGSWKILEGSESSPLTSVRDGSIGYCFFFSLLAREIGKEDMDFCCQSALVYWGFIVTCDYTFLASSARRPLTQL
jgi:hypothetical protein